MDGTREEATGHVAGLLGVERRNVALVESTTHGLNIAAQSIPWREGDEVVMCNLEFLQVAIPFVQLAKTHGVRPVFLEHEAGVVPASAYAAAINERTRAVVLSSVQWCNGYRVDLEAVAEACRARGVWLVVDAVQQAGAVPLPTDGVDFLLAGGHKWLNAPMGTGFAALSDRVLDELQPSSWGYLNLTTPEGGWVNYFTTPTITPDRDYAFTDSAKRFEIGGTGNYPGAVCLSESLRVTNEVGVGAVGGAHLGAGRAAAGGVAVAGRAAGDALRAGEPGGDHHLPLRLSRAGRGVPGAAARGGDQRVAAVHVGRGRRSGEHPLLQQRGRRGAAAGGGGGVVAGVGGCGPAALPWIPAFAGMTRGSASGAAGAAGGRGALRRAQGERIRELLLRWGPSTGSGRTDWAVGIGRPDTLGFRPVYRVAMRYL